MGRFFLLPPPPPHLLPFFLLSRFVEGNRLIYACSHIKASSPSQENIFHPCTIINGDLSRGKRFDFFGAWGQIESYSLRRSIISVREIWEEMEVWLLRFFDPTNVYIRQLSIVSDCLILETWEHVIESLYFQALQFLILKTFGYTKFKIVKLSRW